MRVLSVAVLSPFNSRNMINIYLNLLKHFLGGICQRGHHIACIKGLFILSTLHNLLYNCWPGSAYNTAFMFGS